MDAPPSTPTYEVDIDEDQVAFFHENGYLAIDRITTDEEVEWLRDRFDEIFEQRTGGAPGGFFDTARPYDAEGPDLFAQALLPELAIPELRATQFVRNGKRIACTLLGQDPDDVYHWGHMLRKPARIGESAPWHQDEAYWDPELDYHAVGNWMPLDDADIDNGCLWFLPGSHRMDVLAHKHKGDDPAVHILELVEPIDTSAAVPVPTLAGGASFHHPRTLHFSRPNTTDRNRRAYANEYQTRPVKRDTPADRPWIVEGRQAFESRSVFQGSGAAR
jgi:ectoine hydroxylase-related dioxygenase (phytanoyl-CoA dioxygenase family)